MLVASDDAFQNCYLEFFVSWLKFDARQDDYGIDAVERALGKKCHYRGELDRMVQYFGNNRCYGSFCWIGWNHFWY